MLSYGLKCREKTDAKDLGDLKKLKNNGFIKM